MLQRFAHLKKWHFDYNTHIHNLTILLLYYTLFFLRIEYYGSLFKDNVECLHACRALNIISDFGDTDSSCLFDIHTFRITCHIKGQA